LDVVGNSVQFGGSGGDISGILGSTVSQYNHGKWDSSTTSLGGSYLAVDGEVDGCGSSGSRSTVFDGIDGEGQIFKASDVVEDESCSGSFVVGHQTNLDTSGSHNWGTSGDGVDNEVEHQIEVISTDR
jgi:hypothetical protein